jgi:hypothetical protein
MDWEEEFGVKLWRGQSRKKKKAAMRLKKWLAGKRNRKRTKDSKNLGDNTKSI